MGPGGSREAADVEQARRREPLSEHARRRWRSRGRHGRLRYWLLFRGAPIAAVFLLVYVANGLVIGWRDAYDVTLAIISPAQTSSPLLAWVLSVAGWLVAPGLAGAVAGYVISAEIEARRREPSIPNRLPLLDAVGRVPGGDRLVAFFAVMY
jgi:hypothetical protein